ncbi:MAG: ABC transporter permease subunit [Candidatus Symbiothrix sp.]|jgi:phosphate transport system permease protein|nr:ABC transporter permease subunit [Candidatus Symbiothrix sp.]
MKDKAFKILLFISVISVLLLPLGILFSLIIKSIPAFQHFGIIVSGEWFSFIGYSLSVSVLALIIAAPFSISLLLIYAEYCNGKKIASILAFIMDLFAYIPSIVWGIWAYYNLNLIFDGLGIAHHSFGILPVSIVMASMMIPYSVSVSIHYIPFVPRSIKEGAYCLGATRLEIIGTISFPFMAKGLIATGLLSLAKILGETMVVVILFGKTVTSVVFDRFGTIDDLEFSTLFVLALFLFMVTAAVNIVARYMFSKFWYE